MSFNEIEEELFLYVRSKIIPESFAGSGFFVYFCQRVSENQYLDERVYSGEGTGEDSTYSYVRTFLFDCKLFYLLITNLQKIMRTINLLRKAFLLLALVGGASSAWATGEVFYVKFQNSSNVTQSTANYFSYDKGSGTAVSWSSKGKHSCTYGGDTYSDVIKMESATQCYFTSEAEATITIVQTISNATGDKLKFDGTNLNSEMANTTVTVNSTDKYNEYVITKVAAGTHTITRQSETGLAYVKVEYTGEAAVVVADPVIAWNSGTSQATITCATDGATIYYTTDGSEPTTSSSAYSSAITLTNSTTVRAFAKKSDVSSNLVKRECFVSHSSVSKYLTSLGYNGGTVSGDVWTGTNFTITNNVAERGFAYVNLAGSQDGFKLNHTDSYTIQPSEGIKVTKLVVVGKTWLQGSAGNAATIAFDDWTPVSGTFFDYLTDGETYVKTIEFTPDAAQDYGQAITMRPGTNQLGAYIEVYGDIKTYAVSYAAGANGTGTVAAGVKKHGLNFDLSSNKFTRDGFEQTGWATYDGGPQVYALGGTYTANAAITLYPVWAKMVPTVVNNWDFSDWSDATKTGMLADATNWNQYEKTGSTGTNFEDNGRSNAAERSAYTLKYTDGVTTTNLPETKGLKFSAPAFGIGLMFNFPSATVGGVDCTYHGSQYIWLYNKDSKIIIPDVKVGSVIRIGVESHKNTDSGEARGITLNNATQTLGEGTSKNYQDVEWTVTTAGDITITPTKGLHIYYITVTENKENIPVSTLDGRNYASFVATKKLDFSAADGITAYIATGLNDASDAVVLEPVDVVPVGEPIIVKTETQGATVNVPVTTVDADDVSGNNLIAGDGETSYSTGTYYYLASDLFHLATSGTLQSGKAYLQIPSSARQLGIVFGDDETTGISATLMNNERLSNEFFDLQGRKVAQPTKGLYIVNGKKVIVK